MADVDRIFLIGYVEQMHQKIKSSSGEWEAVCRRCGRCCHEKIDFEGRIYYTDIPCEHLDPVTKRCGVYEKRDTVRPGCVRLTPTKIEKGFLPADCPYVSEVANYPAPVMPDDE